MRPPLAPLQVLVSRLLVPELSSSFYLYTTPPRQVLKDMQASFYKAQLVPAANVYFHVDERKGTGQSSPSSSSVGA